MNAYVDFVDFVIKGKTLEEIIAYRPSPEAQQRVNKLIAALKTDTITPDERAELNHHTEFEDIMRLAKTQARQHVQKR